MRFANFRRDSMRVFKLAFIALFAMTLLVACGKKSPEDVARAFVEKSYAGDADAVIAMLHVSERAEAKPGEQELLTGKLRAMVAEKKAEADDRGGVEKITTEGAQAHPGDAKRASVEVTVHFKQGTSTKERVNLVETDKGWRVRAGIF
ncbi:hypothetical protein CO614_07210 [Lysobacteraceae bacterium NML120232]|nr:hypothetical protein CO614_07210 [Xanthomonadaceae bacterium NML120232]